jgi:hypothetical protein
MPEVRSTDSPIISPVAAGFPSWGPPDFLSTDLALPPIIGVGLEQRIEELGVAGFLARCAEA